MKRPLRAEEQKLWAVVAATVHPRPGRVAPVPDAPAQAEPPATLGPPPRKAKGPPPNPRPRPPPPPRAHPPEAIEPQRKRRLIRQRDDLEGRLDLHGMDQDRARAALHAFLLSAHDRGARAVLVITGKGTLGDGILRRRTPEWLAEPAVRHVVAGVSEAARHHGGAGALYIALKRKV